MIIDKIKLFFSAAGSRLLKRDIRIRLYILIVIIVLVGLNFYLFWLRNSIFKFIGEEASLSNERIENIEKIRNFVPNP